MKIVPLLALAASLAGCADAAFAQVRITEFMYSGADGEFVEITNTGASAVDLTGWSFDDDSNTAGSFLIGALGTLAAGESAVITEAPAANFRTAWQRCAAAKIIGGNAQNLSRNDVINLYDAGGVRVDTLRFGDQTFPGTIRTQNIAGWVSAAGLGADTIAQWTLATVGDAEGSHAATLGDVGSPGVSTRSAAPFDPCAPVGPRMRITEYLYDSADGEFVEFTNVGDAPADMTGWSFDDDSNVAGTVALGAFGTVQPGESVLFTDRAAPAFRTAWQLCSGVKVVGGNTTGLGRADQINLYDAGGTRVDRLTYDDQTIAGSVRAKDRSAWVSANGLGADQALEWTLSAVGDVEDSRTAAAGAIGSPGASTRSLFDFDPCAGSAGAPVVTVDVAATTRRLDLAVNGGGAVAATIGDTTDPAAADGIVLSLADPDGDAAALTVEATSSNLAVVAADGLALSGSGAARTLRITPTGVGYSTITVRATDAGNLSGTYTLAYAASASAGATQRAFTGASDASAAIASGDHMLVADDEGQRLRLYPRDRSGLAENGFDFTASLGLTDIDGGVPREVDIEGAARDGDTVYWTGSHSNKKDNGAARPNRQRVFATQLAGSGAAATLQYLARYDHLRTDLVAWDSGNGHGLGADALGLAASTAIGVWPERDDGFNIEGLAIAPDAAGLFVAFRAPLLPLAQRHDALLVHATNLRSVIASAPPGGSAAAGSATFAAPILLNLGGRGIRDIARTADGRYLIAAGPTATANGVAPSDFRLYLWSGDRGDAPQLLGNDLASIAAAGSIETLVNADAANGDALLLELLSDSGDTIWYADGIVAKDLPEPRHRKFVGARVPLDLAPLDRLFADGFESP
ncbi:MAG TPA: DUF3616 domain-containing protein [Tahibacter sp.]|uniref:DUF3616 domain-containing protein n=1 Tax=Tahibacter sp. TaxID=2056211 RepID=UPI002C1EB64E|nr:DUF3616 domain-containing protein [Tahibacter sp.]HSX62889.1 DUF3616 domain-containing protein [Tahibacter sp.]